MIVSELLIILAMLGSSVLVPEPWNGAAMYVLGLAPSAATLLLFRVDAMPPPPPPASPPAAGPRPKKR